MQVPSMNSLEATAAGAGTDLPSSELDFSRPATRRQFHPWEPRRSHGNPMQILTQTQIDVQAPWRVRGPFQRLRCCGSRSASGVARFERLEDDADTGVQCAGHAAQRAQRMTLVARGFQATDDPIAVVQAERDSINDAPHWPAANRHCWMPCRIASTSLQQRSR